MGCDYFIETYLTITISDKIYMNKLNQEPGYYHYWSYDSDDEDFNEQHEKYKKELFEKLEKTKIFYENGKWINNHIENKYKQRVIDFCKIYNLNVNKISTITKNTSAYERE
jgi:hypothetical protein